MNLSRLLPTLGLAAFTTLCTMNSAYPDTQVQFHVTTYIGSTLSITTSDGLPLETEISLPWSPTAFFESWTRPVVISSNNHGSDVLVSLLSPPALQNGADSIPLSVKLNGTLLSTMPTTYAANRLFANSPGTADSVVMPLWVGVDNSNPMARKPAMGTWVAAVQIVLTQAS